MLPLTAKKSQPDAATRAGMRFLCQTDLYALVKGLLNADRADNCMSESYHKPLCRFIQTTPYAKNLYLMQRGGLKTAIITVGRNIQRILNNPQIRILIASNKSENAEAMLSELKGHLANPWLLWCFPDILYVDPARDAEKWTNSAITVRRKRRTKEATIETIGVSGELTSKHYDHGTFDDVVGKENSQTRDLLLDTIQFIRIAESLFDPGSTRDYVGTPWHYADAWAWLLEQRAKHGLALGTYIDPCWRPCTPGDPQGQDVPGFGWVAPRFPERFPISELLNIRRFKGSAEFAAQYLLNPVSADTAVFRRDKLLIRERAELPDAGSLWCCMTVDPAISTKAWADYSAIAVTGFGPDGTLYILDLRRGKWPESELLHHIYDAWARTPGIRAVGIEAVGFAKIFRRLFTAEGERRGFFLPVVGLERDTKVTKNVRIRALQPPWEAGQIVCASDVPALEDFLEEADRFRLDRESAHDDLLDAVVDSLQLRARPMADDTAWRSFYDDPELVARIRLEQTIQQDRLAQGLPVLDTSSLRVARVNKQLMDELELERAMAGGGGDEFWG